MTMHFPPHVFGLALLAFPSAVFAQCSAGSGASRQHLVELYTSEGCDSCPPAERWMSTLRKHDDLVGLEFHVDYWDNSDWRDPFSDHAYTVRQQEISRRGNRDQTYTPQIWLDGRVWTNWPKGAPPDVSETAPVRMTVAENIAEPLHFRVSIDGPALPDYRLYAALTQNGLAEYIRGGENRGKTLNHDQVVRAFTGPFALTKSDLAFAMPARFDRTNGALVAFVQDERDGSVVQLVRLPFKDCTK